jgi:hypothetical protein
MEVAGNTVLMKIEFHNNWGKYHVNHAAFGFYLNLDRKEDIWETFKIYFVLFGVSIFEFWIHVLPIQNTIGLSVLNFDIRIFGRHK